MRINLTNGMRRGMMVMFGHLLILFLLIPGYFSQPIATVSPDSDGDGPGRAVPDHLLLSEICISPTDGEFIEIYNPNGAQVALDNYYLSDIVDYYGVTDNTATLNGYDFICKFPAGAVIDPLSYIVVAIDGVDFQTKYSKVPNFEIDSVSNVADMVDINIGGTAGLTNDHETLILFHWDGIADLVEDVDLVWWGDQTNYRVDKTGVTIDSITDGDGVSSTYNADASTYTRINASVHGQGDSYKRINLSSEVDEVASGGNGITGHDETTESLSLTWNADTAADPQITTVPESPPMIHSITQSPRTNPSPGTDVVVTANVTDNSALQFVNISYSIDGTTPQSSAMTHTVENNYTFQIDYNEPPMAMGTVVEYNVSATDDDGNVCFSVNYTYYYLPGTMAVLNITEVLFNANGSENQNDFVELYCVDDGNSGNGNSIINWAINDADGTNDKEFPNILVRTGELVVLHYNDAGTADELDSSQGNGDGVIDVYTQGTNSRLSDQGDQVLLFDMEGNMTDAVCWAYNDSLTTTEQNDLNYTVSKGQWVSNNTVDAVDSEYVFPGYSISRNKPDPDTNTKSDWHILNISEPGIFRDLSDDIPVIGSVSFDPIPDGGCVLPFTALNITALITDDVSVSGANISWAVDGIAQSNIALRDDGAGIDELAGDDYWSGVLPGQDEGAQVALFLEAYDNVLQRRKSESWTISFVTPPIEPVVLLTEVMFDPLAGDKWVELFCVDDGNENAGFLMNDWEIDDLDSDADHIFDGTLLKTGEYVVIHYNNFTQTSENSSMEGNGNGIIDRYTSTSNGALTGGGDQMVLFNADGMAVDAVAWQKDGTLSSQLADVNDIYEWNMWSQNTTDSCINVTKIEEGQSISRRYNTTNQNYWESNTKADWKIGTSSPGAVTTPPIPFSFDFTVLMDGVVNVSLGTESYRVTWNVNGDVDLIQQTNLSLYYFENEILGQGEHVGYLDPLEEEYDWDITGLGVGEYYLRVVVNDGVLSEYMKNSTFPINIVEILPPYVESTIPLGDSVNVEIDSNITVTFTNPMDGTTFERGTTFFITPSIEGNLIVLGFVAVFDPILPMAYNTSYSVRVAGVGDMQGLELENEYIFNFTTEKTREYLLEGNVTPGLSILTLSGNSPVMLNGTIHLWLPNGTYELKLEAEGYLPFIKMLNIIGENVDLGEIELSIIMVNVTIGPFTSGNQRLVGVQVTFTIGGVDYSNITGSDGMAGFTILKFQSIPDGTEVIASFDEEEKSWRWNVDEAPYGAFSKEGGVDDDDGVDGDGSNASSLLWTLLIIIVVLIILVAIAMSFYLYRNRDRVPDNVIPEPVHLEEENGNGGVEMVDYPVLPQSEGLDGLEGQVDDVVPEGLTHTSEEELSYPPVVGDELQDAGLMGEVGGAQRFEDLEQLYGQSPARMQEDLSMLNPESPQELHENDDK